MAKNNYGDEFDFEIDNDEIRDKKSKKEKTNYESRRLKRNKSFSALIGFLILVGIATLFIIKNDFRDKIVYPALREIPVVGSLIPQEKNIDSSKSKEELQKEKIDLEKKLYALTKEYEDLKLRYDDRGNEITRLKVFADQQEEFKRDKEEISEALALKNPKDFAKYYETIFPENADKFYKEVVKISANDKEKKKFYNTFLNMKDDSAAKILEEMMSTEIETVVEILKNVDTEKSAGILAKMKVQNAASVARRLAESGYEIANLTSR